MREYRVASTNVFNMDETGFMFGLGSRERVIVPTGDLASRFGAQPGIREKATVIECIGSAGQVLPPLLGFVMFFDRIVSSHSCSHPTPRT